MKQSFGTVSQMKNSADHSYTDDDINAIILENKQEQRSPLDDPDLVGGELPDGYVYQYNKATRRVEIKKYEDVDAE